MTGFRPPLANANRIAAEETSMKCRKAAIDSIMARPTLSDSDLQRFMQLTGVRPNGMPRTGPDLAAALAEGNYIRTRIFVGT